MLNTLYCRYFQRAFFYSVPIGGLAGLIGLGGGEFRLPVLTQVIGFSPWAAIPLNLLISLATLSFALVQLHRSVFAMHCPCDKGDYETPNVCWSAVEHAPTVSGERPSLTRCLRVTTLPDPACQREQPTSLSDRGTPRMYGTNRAQHDSCVQSRHDDLLAS